MSKIREQLPKNKHSSSRSQFTSLSSHPYDQIPICLKDSSRPFNQAITLQDYGLTRKAKVRQIASREIENHFGKIHRSYRSKQNEMMRSFNIRTKKSSAKQSHPLPEGLQQWIQLRQGELASLHRNYLKEVKGELGKAEEEEDSQFSKEEKIINEYNIIYDYKTNLESFLKQKQK